MLPSQKTKPVVEVTKLRALLYGAPKTGKSTWCSQIDNALFLATEPGLNNLETYQISITNWDDLLNASAEILKGEHKFDCIVIDTIDNAYKMCCEYILAKYNKQHPTDMNYGKGWDLVIGEFRRVITKLAQLPYGLILVSHAQSKRTTSLLHGDRERIVPTVPDRIREFLLGFVDAILYCDVETQIAQVSGSSVAKTKHVMRTRPHLDYEAGCRFDQVPDVLPLEYKAFLAAFEGEKKPATKTETKQSKLAEVL